MMQLVAYFAFLLLASAQKGHSGPRLKPGKSAFASRVARFKASGKARVSFDVSEGESVVLELEPHTELLSPEYEEYEITPTGKQTRRTYKDMKPCWYRGTVVGDPESIAIVTDCDGFEGFVRRSNRKDLVAKSTDDKNGVAVYLSEDEEVVPGGCGLNEHQHQGEPEEHRQEHQGGDYHQFDSTLPPHASSILDTDGPFKRRLLDYNSQMNVVEVALFSDYGYIQALGGTYGRNLSAIAARNIQLVNIAHATYQATTFTRPTSIKLKAQYFFSSGDPYTTTLDASGQVNMSTLLSRFRTYSMGIPQYSTLYDHMHLLTYYDFVGSTIGLAYVESACSSYMQGTTMMSMPLGQAANIFAHELGHTLGMLHDGQVGTPASTCSSTGYLMAATSSCPLSGLCPLSSCSVSAKNTYTSTVSCLYSWTNSSCSDGLWGGNETGVDCGGECPPCPAIGCNGNNGGCSDICTPLGGTDFVCSCNDANWYVDPEDGKTCKGDIDQCQDFRCEQGCINSIGPGNSFSCTCTQPDQLSLFDASSCLPPSCVDRRRNQGETMIDCGGTCARPCGCFQSSVSFRFPDDRGVDLNGARWLTWDDSGSYAAYAHGVPVRFIRQSSPTQWIYDNDNESEYSWGYVNTNSPIPYSGVWRMYNGSAFLDETLTFEPCANVSSVCGNGVVEGTEECDSCSNFTGGVCVTPNLCCDSTCTSPALRGSQCAVDNLRGACWDGSCVTRAASCEIHTVLMGCFGANCTAFSGGQGCSGVQDPVNFTSGVCTEQFYCYKSNCAPTDLASTPPIGPTRGFPCSSVNNVGRYSMVCDGGTDGTGSVGSACVSVDSLTDFMTMAPSTKRPTPPTANRPTSAPSTLAPSTAPTASALSAGGVLRPTLFLVVVLMFAQSR